MTVVKISKNFGNIVCVSFNILFTDCVFVACLKISIILQLLPGDTHNITYRAFFYWNFLLGIPVSYFNHSCAPNAYITSSFGFNTCVSVRPIRKGEQICVAYSDKFWMEGTATRQQMIQNAFNFQCKCKRCKSRQLENSCNSYSPLILDPVVQSFYAEMDPIYRKRRPSRERQELDKPKIFSLLEKYKDADWSFELLLIMDGLNILEAVGTLSSTDCPFAGTPMNFERDY